MNRAAVVAAALVFVTACSTTNVTQVEATGVGMAAPPPAPAPPKTAQPRVPLLHVGAVSGRLQRLNFSASLDDSCVSLGAPEIGTARAPAHGTVGGEPTTDFPRFPSGSPRAHCNDRRVPGSRITYRSEPGYKGPDPFIATVLYPDGARATIAYDMFVQ